MIKRRKVRDSIFEKEYRHEEAEIPYGDLPKDLLDTDVIHYESDGGHYSENNSWDPFTRIVILRERDQTDEEHQVDIDWWAKKTEESRKARYTEYLRLKEEVETGKLTPWNYVMTEEEKAEFERYSERNWV